MEENVTQTPKSDFFINTQIVIKDADHIEYLVDTDINESDPEYLEQEDVYDPNDLLYFFWAYALASASGLVTEEAKEKLAFKLTDIISEVQNDSVANQIIEEKLKIPPPVEEDIGDGSDLEIVNAPFINVKIHFTEGRKQAQISTETNVPNYHPEEGKNKYLIHLWTRAMASCSIVLRNRAEKEYLGRRLYDEIMNADETLLASINDSDE